MMKKISKILIAIVLLFSIGITNAFAATTGTFYRYSWANTTSEMKKKNMIEYDWFEGTGSTEGTLLCANSYNASCKRQKSYWNVYYVKSGNKYYISYCVNPYLSLKHKDSGKIYDSLDNMKFSVSTISEEEKTRRKELIKQLLLYGYNVNPENNRTVGTVITNDNQAYLKLIAMQVLIWEIMEGGRTDFTSVAPDLWNGENSFYNQVIYPNGGSDPKVPNTLYYYYQTAREAARVGSQVNPAPAFDTEVYTMAWDSVNKKYTVTVTGLGDYGKNNACVSSNPKVTISDVTNSTITLSSTETISNARITCSYSRGSGPSDQSKEEIFKFFRFNNDASSRQDMIYGSGWKKYSKYFDVTTENSNVLIKKVDSDSRFISGAKFTLTHMTNLSYSVIIDGNGTAQNLILSGKYRVSETTAPAGYEKINDFNITINAKTHKITSCDQEKKDGNGNIVSCLNDQVKVRYSSDRIELTVVDVAKNLKIIKVDKDGSPVAGATFEVRDANNNLVKFSMGSGNIYKYDTAGTITSLTNSSSYPISLLPEGDYKIIETSAAPNYRLPADESLRTTLIRINSNSDLSVYDKSRNSYIPSPTGIIRIINYKTRININKTGHGKPLEGVQFELYNEDKTVKIKSTLGLPGKYTYADNQASAENYVYVTNANGEITIDNIPEGTYYLKEIATVDPFVLPEGDAVYTKIVINIDEQGVSVNGNYSLDTIEISNSPNSFNFYKRDTEGNPLTTGKYKLQKYDKNAKKYVDLKLVEVENDGTYNPNSDIYKVDEQNGKIQFTLTKGIATFIDMESSTTYRIIETLAPEGYTKAAAKDTATVYVDEHGNASGLLVLIDQRLPKEDESAFAELIINIQTGKQRIMYAAVILVVIGLIAALIIYNKRK